MEIYRFTDAEKELMEHSPVPFAIYQFIDRRVVTVMLSGGFCELFGYTDRAEAYYDMDHDMYKDTHPDDVARIADAAVCFAKDNSPDARYDVVYRVIDKQHTGCYMVHAIGKHIYTKTGERLAYVWYTIEGDYNTRYEANDLGFTDSLKNTLREESFHHEGHYDSLTGLPSMAYFFELAVAGRDSMVAAGKSPVMLFMDMCRMKYYNHRYGFAKGDMLLQAFGRLIAHYFGNENCCRISEDHFAAFTDEDGLEHMLKDLLTDARELNNGVSLPVHIGIYMNRVEELGAAIACDRAKLACDSLRHRYTSAFCHYDTTMRDAEEKRQYIAANIDKAVSKGWITVYYQPIVRAVNGRVCDEEALARWNDPVNGFMSPDDFIPVLENCGLIYKLDLCVLESVLKKLKKQKEAGLHVVPQSINLSRSDFDSCDIVEEIRRRVDDCGISRELITIEITESVIGRDFEFMKEQVSRFRELGFAVWMDDFGSGYSSLDVLKGIEFDLIKFDMRFLQHFDDDGNGRIILTELVKMATFLGTDTVCEGVETASQVRFLREIGCSKLQGYYYAKPMPLEAILERYEKGTQIGFENPAESGYFETIGRINLHDLAVITQDSGRDFHNFFNMLPMAVIELRDGETVRVARSNQSCRDFIERYFGFRMTDREIDFYSETAQSTSTSLAGVIRQCRGDDDRTFVDLRLSDGATVHYFVRRMAENPVTGTIAAVVVVLSIQDPEQGMNYANIARALAADYFRLYYVDLNTEDFIEYTSAAGKEVLAVERHGKDFFSESSKEALRYVFKEDQNRFLQTFTKEKLVSALEEQGVFALSYRLIIDGEPVYVVMKAMRMNDNGDHIIIGISNVDSQIRQKELLAHIERDRVVYLRIMALTGDYIALYTVDPESGEYYQYSAAKIYEGLGFADRGDDFFLAGIVDGERTVAPEDYPKYREQFGKNNIMRAIRRTGVFTMQYHLVLGGKPRLVRLKAVLVRESDGDKLIVGVERIGAEQAED